MSVPQQPLYFQELLFLGANGFDADIGGTEYDFHHFDCSEFPATIGDLDSAVAHHQRALKHNGTVTTPPSQEPEQPISAQPNAHVIAHGLAHIGPSTLTEEIGSNVVVSTLPTNSPSPAQNRPMQGQCSSCQQLTKRYKGKSSSGKFRFACTNKDCSKKTFSVSSR